MSDSTRPIVKKRKLFCVVGKTGTGKTYLTEQALIPRMGPCVICDPRAEYGERGPTAGWPILYTPPDFFDLAEQGFSGCVLRLRSAEDYAWCFDYCTELEPHTLIVDEISNFMDPWHCPTGLEVIAFQGRHLGISLIAITQRPKQIHEAIRSQADAWIMFRITEPHHIDYLTNATGENQNGLADLTGHNYRIAKT